MFRGSDELANFWFGSSANSLNLNSSRGAFRFASGNTSGTLNEAFEIVGGTGSDKGWIGIGDWDDFDPNTNLHIHQSSSSGVGIQLTNSTSGTGTTDGWKMLFNSSNKFIFSNFENGDIGFETGSPSGSYAERMKICSGANYGRVLIGAAGPGAQLDVYDATDLKANGDDIGLQVNEEINDNDSANYFNNRAIAAELYA